MLTADYHYLAADGALLFRVERHTPKRFLIYDPSGRELSAVPCRALYRHPELLTADPSALVYAVEGEKDVETLRSHRRLATSNAGGCVVGWDATLAEHLRGRHVVVLPDHDKPGRLHAERVRDLLLPVAASVVVVPLPRLRRAEDVTDWFDRRRGTLDELDRLVGRARRAELGLPGGKLRPSEKADLILGAGLPPTPKLVLLVLYVGRESRGSSPGTATEVAKAASVHPVTARRALADLRRRKVLAGDGRAIDWDALALLNRRPPPDRGSRRPSWG
jgi:hypothetical protein